MVLNLTEMSRRIMLIFIFVALHAVAVAQSVPFPTDNLQLWLCADSVELTDGKVSRWFDQSPNQYEIVQTKAVAMPTCNSDALNGLPAIVFDGSSNYLTGGDILDLRTDSWTWFIVGCGESGSILAKTLYQGNVKSYYNVGTKNIRFLNKSITYELMQPPKILNWINDINNGGSIFINNRLVATTESPSVDNYDNDLPFFVGGCGNRTTGQTPASTQYLKGYIAEIIAFNSVDSVIRLQVTEYLANKYFPEHNATVSFGPEIHVPYGFTDTAIITAYKPYFESYLWNTGETDSVIHVNKSGKYWVTVTNSFGIISSDTINVYYPEPMQLRDTTICAGDTLVWDAALNGPYSYLWSDGSTESSLEITTAGEYYVVITDTAGYSWKSDTITVNIDSFPVTARLESKNIEACIGNNIYLQNGYDEAVNYWWSDGTNADHLSVATTGTYWVKVADRLGCKAADTAHIEVLGIAPTPDFIHTALCATRDIVFSNQSHSNDASQINGYLWQFGDGQTSTEASPAHAYSYSGTYNLQLTVSTTNGCRNLL